MHIGRLLALSMVGALTLHVAQPAFGQASDDASDAVEQNETPATTPAKPQPQRKPAPKAARHAAPAKVPASAPETTSSGKPPITAQDVRPPANMMIDCAKAPAEAVTKLPDDLAKWATVYCTKLGHIFNANDQHFGAFPDSGLRASFNAADIAGKSGEVGNEAYFTKIAYRELPPAERDALIASDESVKKILVGKSLWRVDLTAVGGNSLSFLVIDPSADVFWVFPLNDKGLGQPAFYVTSLEALNRAR